MAENTKPFAESLPSVVILMATLNGEAFLDQQLDSIELQDFKNWRLIVSDDGSTDQTLEILSSRQAKWGESKLEIRVGRQKGFATNFLSLAIDPTIQADYFAFCDQDDYWLPEKLSKAIEHLANGVIHGKPNLYCGRTIYTDASLKKIGMSPLFVHPKSFRNAIIQSIAGGNTMVFDTNFKKLLETIGLVEIVSHDWWLYQLATGTAGRVVYDPVPTILYRQHHKNLVGENGGIWSKIKRLTMLLDGRFKNWNDINTVALLKNKDHLDHINAEILALFIRMRTARLKDRLRLMEVCGLYRQSWHGTISLIFAALLKKL